MWFFRAVFFLLVLSSVALARPGGGSGFRSSSHSSSSRSSGSYSGSSHYSGSSSSGGNIDFSDPETVRVTLSTLFGLLLAIPGLIGVSLAFGRDRKAKDWQPFRRLVGLLLLTGCGLIVTSQLHKDGVASVVAIIVVGCMFGGTIVGAFSSAPIEATTVAPPRAPRNVGRALTALRGRDAGFSRVSFLDWTQAIYHGAHNWLGRPEEKNLAPFVDDSIRAALHDEVGGTKVDAIVIGAMTITEVDLEGDRAAIVVDLDTNYTVERDPPERFVLHETWRFERDAAVLTPPPARMRALSCPACGAVLSVNELGACTYCGASLLHGKLQWRATRRAVLSRETFSTEGLGETVPEAGTELPTRIDRDLTDNANEIALAHGLPDAGALASQLETDVVRPVFKQMYEAWSNRRWNDARHLLTDRLWESQRAWVELYTQKGLVNRLADLRVGKVELVRAERDRDYEAATVRIFATCCDYTVDRSGNVIGGDAKRPRAFSEYWVFIRSSQAKDPAAPRAEAKCPSCGAPLDKLGATGVCGYCNAKVTTGDFGWVLSAIVQDETYRG